MTARRAPTGGMMGRRTLARVARCKGTLCGSYGLRWVGENVSAFSPSPVNESRAFGPFLFVEAQIFATDTAHQPDNQEPRVAAHIQDQRGIDHGR